MAKPTKIVIKITKEEINNFGSAIIIEPFFSINESPIFIIEELKKPCKRVAIPTPIIKSMPLFFVSKIDKAKKQPRVPEQRACKNVAPINLKNAR